MLGVVIGPIRGRNWACYSGYILWQLVDVWCCVIIYAEVELHQIIEIVARSGTVFWEWEA